MDNHVGLMLDFVARDESISSKIKMPSYTMSEATKKVALELLKKCTTDAEFEGALDMVYSWGVEDGLERNKEPPFQ